jgi:hypothetical protein
MDEETPADYVPFKDHWRTSEIPQGFKCVSPYVFPELSERGAAPAAGLDDQLEMIGEVVRARRTRK